MYNRIYDFFTKTNLISPLKFGFRQRSSTFHALISVTEDIRKNLDKRNIGCGICVDLQKSFDTFEHDILLLNLNIMPYMVSQMNGLNPTSLFLLMVMFLIKPL